MAGDADDGPPADDERQEDIELAGAVDEMLGAIERVRQPATPGVHAGGIVGAFFGQDGVVRKGGPDPFPDDPV